MVAAHVRNLRVEIEMSGDLSGEDPQRPSLALLTYRATLKSVSLATGSSLFPTRIQTPTNRNINWIMLNDAKPP